VANHRSEQQRELDHENLDRNPEDRRSGERGIFNENFNPSQMRSCIYTFRCESQSARVSVWLSIRKELCSLDIVEILACTAYM